MPPLWRRVLGLAHPVSRPKPPRDADGVLRWTRYSDWLAGVPRLTPLWGNWYVGCTDESPVFSIHQTNLYVPALCLADLLTGRGEDPLPSTDHPIGSVPFWSDPHAYSQLGVVAGTGE